MSAAGLHELAPDVYCLGSGKGGHVRAFLLDAARELTLVDTLFEDDARLVLGALDQLGRKPGDVKRIVLTHAHRSHLGGLLALKQATGAPVLAHEWEADIVGGERRAQPGSLRPVLPLSLIPFRLGLLLNKPKHRPCPVDETIGEGDAVGPLHVLFTPGHSPGHLAFHWPERGLLIAGDSVATWPNVSAGWQGFNLNEREHRASVARLAAIEAPIVGVGHGDPITNGAAETLHALVA